MSRRECAFSRFVVVKKCVLVSTRHIPSKSFNVLVRIPIIPSKDVLDCTSHIWFGTLFSSRGCCVLVLTLQFITLNLHMVPYIYFYLQGYIQRVLITYKHVGTQTDPPVTRPVGTQLSKGTLKVHVRSKGKKICQYK